MNKNRFIAYVFVSPLVIVTIYGVIYDLLFRAVVITMILIMCFGLFLKYNMMADDEEKNN